MIACDTNIFLHAANQSSPLCTPARAFLDNHRQNRNFVLCELILFELYMQLRNPAIFTKPLTASRSFEYCQAYRRNSNWQIIDYDPAVTAKLWNWAKTTRGGFRLIIDARIAFTLLHHGVEEFATANVRDFKKFGLQRVWDPLKESK